MPTAIPRDDPAYDGQAVYTAGFLRFYDLLVLRFNGHLAWRCGPGRLVRMYDEHVSARHLDIGVGTGYFLDKCRFPVASPDCPSHPNLGPSPDSNLRVAFSCPEKQQSSGVCLVQDPEAQSELRPRRSRLA